MHERSIVRKLLKQVEQVAQERQSHRVVSVRISVGGFSGIEPELLRTAFCDLSEESLARGAELRLETVPLEAACDACGSEFAVERFQFRCPTCESQQVQILRGEALMLESVTLEDPNHD
jgi:hydrogenase nickel incorporation protein HypA/HybF